MASRKPKTVARGYGEPHRALRRRWARTVAAGSAICARCGNPIERGEPWDLDHNDDRTGYLGASHASCNRAKMPQQDKFARAIAAHHGNGPLEDDPAHGVFWGPPNDTGYQPRWSQVWFDWRNEPAFR